MKILAQPLNVRNFFDVSYAQHSLYNTTLFLIHATMLELIKYKVSKFRTKEVYISTWLSPNIENNIVVCQLRYTAFLYFLFFSACSASYWHFGEQYVLLLPNHILPCPLPITGPPHHAHFAIIPASFKGSFTKKLIM